MTKSQQKAMIISVSLCVCVAIYRRMKKITNPITAISKNLRNDIMLCYPFSPLTSYFFESLIFRNTPLISATTETIIGTKITRNVATLTLEE